MTRIYSAGCLLLAMACSSADVASRPEVATQAQGLGAIETLVVERSAALSPDWVKAKARVRSGARLDFVGSAFADSLEAAKQAALQEVLASIGTYTSVDLRSSFEEKVSAGAGEATSIEVRSKTESKSEVMLQGITADEAYWERLANPLLPAQSSYRYFVRAWIDRAEVERARLQRQAERAKRDRAAPSVAVLPIEVGLREGGLDRSALALGLQEGLAQRLRGASFRVIEPALLRAVASGPREEALEAALVTLLPDKLVDTKVDQSGGRLKLTMRLFDGAKQSQVGRVVLKGESRAIDALLDRATKALFARWGEAQQSQEPTRAPTNGASAFEAKAQARALMASGRYEEALQKLDVAIAAEPKEPALHMLAGRILEKMGRLARIASLQAGAAKASSAPPPRVETCTELGRKASGKAMRFLQERAKRLAAPAPAQAWWRTETMSVDAGLKIATERMDGSVWKNELLGRLMTTPRATATYRGENLGRQGLVLRPGVHVVVTRVHSNKHFVRVSAFEWQIYRNGYPGSGGLTDIGWVRLTDLVQLQRVPRASSRVTLNTQAILRSGPGEKFFHAGVLKAGAKASVIKRFLGWVFIEAGTKTGWVPNSLLTLDRNYPCGSSQQCTRGGLCPTKGQRLCTLAIGPTRRTPWSPKTKRADSAVESYLAALVLAKTASSAVGRRAQRGIAADAALAIAALGGRADRTEPSLRLYRMVREDAIRAKDLHRESLARYGAGAVLRGAQRYAKAKAQLEASLKIRQRLGEKPYLLEIRNELGGLAVETGRFTEAAQQFASALRLADALNNDYLRAVLSNNLGVLEMRVGKARSAQERFVDAHAHLANIKETEGLLSAGLNLAHVLGRAGEGTQSQTLLRALEQIAESTMQEARLAQVHAQRGLRAFREGEHEEALNSTAIAAHLLKRLAKPVDFARVKNNLSAIEAKIAEPKEQVCLARVYWRAGTPVFETAPGAQPAQTLNSIPVGKVQAQDLSAALNAASLIALVDWQAPYPSYMWRGQRRTVLEGLEEIEVTTRPPPKPPIDQPIDRPTATEPTMPEKTVDVLKVVPGVSHSDAKRPVGPPVKYTKPAVYERILGAFVADPNAQVMLRPADLQAHFQPDRAESALKMLEAVARHFEALGEHDPRAIARLNAGAVYWYDGQSDKAYRAIMEAREHFVRSNHLQGLAAVYEWLGLFFEQSDRPGLADRHRWVARALARKFKVSKSG